MASTAFTAPLAAASVAASSRTLLHTSSATERVPAGGISRVRSLTSRRSAWRQWNGLRALRSFSASGSSADAAQPPAVGPISPVAATQQQPAFEKFDMMEEKVTQHTLHVLVDDEAGILTRVAGLFSRRGYNIDSLAVGLTNTRALITMVVPGDGATITLLSRQLLKLINVLKVQDISDAPKTQRELMLIKLGVGPELRNEVMEIADIFRARIVEVTEATITLEVTGDPGKTVAIQKILSTYNIIEVARTGKIALLRDSQVDTNFLRVTGANNKLFDAENLGPTAASLSSLASESLQSAPRSSMLGKLHTISVLVQDVAGILVKVTTLFSRRGYNIESLAVGPAEKPGHSRITVIVPGEDTVIVQICRQLSKLIEVLDVRDITEVPTVQRELMLIKVGCKAGPSRSEVLQIAKVYRAKVLDIGDETMTVEVTGDPGKLAAILQMLRKFGIREVARTGKIALVRESKVNTTEVNEGRFIPAPLVAADINFP